MADIRMLNPDEMRSLARRLDDTAGSLRYQHGSIRSTLSNVGRSSWSIRRLLTVAAEQEDFAQELRKRAAVAEGWQPFNTPLLLNTFRPGAVDDIPVIDAPSATVDEALEALRQALENGKWDHHEMLIVRGLIWALKDGKLEEFVGNLTSAELEQLLFGTFHAGWRHRTFGDGDELSDEFDESITRVRRELLANPEVATTIAGKLPERYLDDLAKLITDQYDPYQLRDLVDVGMDALATHPEIAELLVDVVDRSEIPNLHLAIDVNSGGAAIGSLLLEATRGDNIWAIAQLTSAMEVVAADEKTDGYPAFAVDVYDALGEGVFHILRRVEFNSGVGDDAILVDIVDRLANDVALLTRVDPSGLPAMLLDSVGSSSLRLWSFTTLLVEGRYAPDFLVALAGILATSSDLDQPQWQANPRGFWTDPINALLIALNQNPVAARDFLFSPGPDGKTWLEFLAGSMDSDFSYQQVGPNFGELLVNGDAEFSDEQLGEIFRVLAYGDLGNEGSQFWIGLAPFIEAHLGEITAGSIRLDSHFDLTNQDSQPGVDFRFADVEALLDRIMEQPASRDFYTGLLLGYSYDVVINEISDEARLDGLATDDFIGMVLRSYEQALIADEVDAIEARQQTIDLVVKVVTLIAVGVVPSGAPLALSVTAKSAVWFLGNVAGDALSLEGGIAQATSDAAQLQNEAALLNIVAITLFNSRDRAADPFVDMMPSDIILDPAGNLLELPPPPTDAAEYALWLEKWSAEIEAFETWFYSEPVREAMEHAAQDFLQDMNNALQR